jgi:hypothetical protein
MAIGFCWSEWGCWECGDVVSESTSITRNLSRDENLMRQCELGILLAMERENKFHRVPGAGLPLLTSFNAVPLRRQGYRLERHTRHGVIGFDQTGETKLTSRMLLS